MPHDIHLQPDEPSSLRCRIDMEKPCDEALSRRTNKRERVEDVAAAIMGLVILGSLWFG